MNDTASQIDSLPLNVVAALTLTLALVGCSRAPTCVPTNAVLAGSAADEQPVHHSTVCTHGRALTALRGGGWAGVGAPALDVSHALEFEQAIATVDATCEPEPDGCFAWTRTQDQLPPDARQVWFATALRVYEACGGLVDEFQQDRPQMCAALVGSGAVTLQSLGPTRNRRSSFDYERGRPIPELNWSQDRDPSESAQHAAARFGLCVCHYPDLVPELRARIWRR